MRQRKWLPGVAVIFALGLLFGVFRQLPVRAAVSKAHVVKTPVAENGWAWQNPRGRVTAVPEPDESGFFVVRAYYTDKRSVRALAGWREPWEVNEELGYVVVGVTRGEMARLRAIGFRVQVDWRLTEAFLHPAQAPLSQNGGIAGFPCYRTVEETYASMRALAKKAPALAAVIDIGDSWEKVNPGGKDGYDLLVLRLTNSQIHGQKPKLFIMTSVHAREYTPAELNMRFAEYLVENYGKDADVTWLLDYHEIHLLVQANPDGRKQAETGLLWRKNTNATYCVSGVKKYGNYPFEYPGADLNRNFSYGWHGCNNDSCSSGNECKETYRGPSAASEPETQAIENYLKQIFPDQRGASRDARVSDDATGVFLDIHSYSGLVLWPWGFGQDAPNGAALRTLGRKFAFFNHYSPKRAAALYETDGSTLDYAYGELGLSAFTFELGSSFFEECRVFTNTILRDNLPALLYAAKVARKPYLLPKGPDVVDLHVEPGAEAVTVTAVIDDSRYNNSNGREDTQPIAQAAYYLDVPPWDLAHHPVSHPLAARDGAFDETSEEVRAVIDTSTWSNARHILYVRGQDADGNQGPVSAIFIGEENAKQQLIKKVSSNTVVPGQVLAFTITQHLAISGTHTYSVSLRDPLTTGLQIVAASLKLNGNPKPDLFVSNTHSIVWQASGTFTDAVTNVIVFQAQVKDTAGAGTIINNTVHGRAYADVFLLPDTSASVSIEILALPADKIFLPIIER